MLTAPVRPWLLGHRYLSRVSRVLSSCHTRQTHATTPPPPPQAHPLLPYHPRLASNALLPTKGASNRLHRRTHPPPHQSLLKASSLHLSTHRPPGTPETLSSERATRLSGDHGHSSDRTSAPLPPALRGKEPAAGTPPLRVQRLCRKGSPPPCCFTPRVSQPPPRRPPPVTPVTTVTSVTAPPLPPPHPFCPKTL